MRIAAVLTLLVSIGVAVGLSVHASGARDAALAKERDDAGKAAASAAERALQAEMKRLEDQVRLQSQGESLRRVIGTNAQTIVDQLGEEGLRSLQALEVYVIRRPLLSPAESPDAEDIHIVHGLDQVPVEDLDRLPAAQAALANPNAPAQAALLRIGGGAALLAVAPVTSYDGSARGYLAIGERLSPATLKAFATESRATLLLSDGARELGFAGEPALEEPLRTALGREATARDASYVAPGGMVVARSLPLSPPVSLWAGTSIAEKAAVLEHEASLATALAWILSLVVGLAISGVLFVKGRPKPAPAPAPAPPAPAPLDAWAGGAPPAPVPNPGASAPIVLAPGQTGPAVLVPVMLPNGQVGQVLAAGITAPGMPPGFPALAAMSPGVTLPQTGTTDPTMFGRYKLLERLGAGGMAEVWTAVVFGAEGFRRPFVVKRILKQHAGNQDLVQQFIDEANLASQLVHSNVVPVFDFGNLNGEYFLAQEYILGRDLGKVTAALAERGQRLDATLAAFICAEVLKALDYAHTLTDKQGRPLGIVHRDISPNNILISGRGEVKLIDFGIAKSAAKVSQTEIGTVKGNIRFMAPEQARGEATDPRTDLFSLGASLFFALRGEPLYTVNGQYEQLLAAAQGPGEAERARIDELPPPLNALIVPALAPAREQRYPSAASFLEHLAPAVPHDGGRRLAGLMHELFGAELARQEQQFAAATTGAPAAGYGEDATVQRPAVKLPTGTT